MGVFRHQPDLVGCALPLLQLLQLGDELAGTLCSGLRTVLEGLQSEALEKAVSTCLASDSKV